MNRVPIGALFKSSRPHQQWPGFTLPLWPGNRPTSAFIKRTFKRYVTPKVFTANGVHSRKTAMKDSATRASRRLVAGSTTEWRTATCPSDDLVRRCCDFGKCEPCGSSLRATPICTTTLTTNISSSTDKPTKHPAWPHWPIASYLWPESHLPHTIGRQRQLCRGNTSSNNTDSTTPRQHFDTRHLTENEVVDWITIYNHQSLHSTHGCTGPMAFGQK